MGAALATLMASGCGGRTGLRPSPLADSEVGSGGSGGAGGSGGNGTTSSTSSTTTGSSSSSSGGGAGGALAECPAVTCTSWSEVWPDATDSTPYAVSGDPCGGIAIAGRAGVPFEVDGQTVNEFFVARLDTVGGPSWERDLWTGVGQPRLYLAADTHGGVVVAGQHNGGWAIDGESVSSDGVTNLVLALDAQGHAKWLRGLAGEGARITAVAADPQGHVLLAGVQDGGIDAGGGPLAGRAFLVRLSPFGEHAWSYGFGDALTQPLSVATDDEGSVYVAGSFMGTLSIADGATLDAAGDAQGDVFVVKLDPSGQAVYAKRFGDEQTQGGGRLSVAGDGTTALLASVAGTVDFGGGPLSAPGPFPSAVAIARFDSMGGFESAALIASGAIVSFYEPPGFEVALGPTDAAVVSVLDAGVPLLLSVDASSQVANATPTTSPAGSPHIARVPGGTAVFGATTTSIDLGGGSIPGPSLYVARVCESLSLQMHPRP